MGTATRTFAIEYDPPNAMATEVPLGAFRMTLAVPPYTLDFHRSREESTLTDLVVTANEGKPMYHLQDWILSVNPVQTSVLF